MTFRKGEGIIGWVADYGKPVNIPDTAADKRFKQGHDQGFSVRSIAAAPVHVGDRVIGVLASTSPETEAFSDDDSALLTLLANCTVPVIERARLGHLSPYDEMTLALKGSETMPRIEDEMLRARQTGSPLSLMVMALDDLEHVYREHDFETGNRLLRKFADRVRELSHSTHKLIRRGVESFVVILPDTTGAMAMQHAEMIRMSMCDYPLHVGDHLVIEQHATVAVSSLKPEETPAAWLKRTEQVAARAQLEEGNTVVWAGRNIPRA
jgi:diguanylate cyclase (GGDEF)-like protein